MHLSISHHTRYEYDRVVQILPHLLYVRPRDNPLMKVDQFQFTFAPDARVQWMRDDFDNLPASVQFNSQAASLDVHSDCTVTTTDAAPFNFLLRDYATTFPFAYEPLHRFNLSIYLTPPEPSAQDALRRWLSDRFTNRPRETVAWLFALNQVLCRSLAYRWRDEPGIQTAVATIELGTGSCRDFAVLLVECARTLGLAARFVSGYMFDPTRDGTGGGAMHA